MSGPILTTERLVLSRVAVDDFEDLCALWADEAFTRHITPQPLTPEEVWFRLLRDIGHWSALGRGNWSIRLKDGGDYLGSAGVFDYRRQMTPAFDAPELGWGVSPAFQGRGYAAEAVATALAWTDRALEASRTVCMIAPDNAPSMRLAARMGFEPYAATRYKGSAVTLLERPRAATT